MLLRLEQGTWTMWAVLSTKRYLMADKTGRLAAALAGDTGMEESNSHRLDETLHRHI